MKFYGEILIFSMLLLTNGRILFLKRAKKDAIVMLAPLALLLSVLQIIAWGVDFFTICAFVISVLVVLSNFHALFRYSQRLYIDHYSVLMKVWAAFTIVLAFVALSGLIVFSRVNLNTKKTNVVETKYRLDGSFKSGFYKTSLFSIPNAQITEFSENPTQTHKKVVVVIPDKRCDTENLKPYLFMLARAGFTVYSGDFYTNDCKWLDSVWNSKYFRRFSLLIEDFANHNRFVSHKEMYTYNSMLECKAMYDFVREKHGEDCKMFLISDMMSKNAVEDFCKLNPDAIFGSLDLSSISEYRTAGYGCVEQTDPLLARILGFKKDKEFLAAKKMVLETSKQIKNSIGN